MSVQSVDRALRLLEAISEEPCGLVEAANRTDLPLSTASRLLAALEERDAVTRGADGTWAIGGLVHRLATGEAVGVLTIQELVAPKLAELVDAIGEAAALSIPIGNETLTIMQLDSPQPVRAEDWTGHRWPITGGGSGAVLMGTWPADRVEPLLDWLGAKERLELREEIAEARKRRISWSRGSYVEGLTSVAAPIVGPDGKGVAALMAYGPSYRFPQKGSIRRTETTLRAAAESVSDQIGQRRI